MLKSFNFNWDLKACFDSCGWIYSLTAQVRGMAPEGDWKARSYVGSIVEMHLSGQSRLGWGCHG